MEDEMANLRLDEEDEDAEVTEQELQFSLVGTCLTDSVDFVIGIATTYADKSSSGCAKGFRPNSYKATVNGLMKLGSDGKNNLIQADDGKKRQMTLEIQLDLNLKTDKEEMFWEQWARFNWLSNRDRNITFFHKMATGSKERNAIKGFSTILTEAKEQNLIQGIRIGRGPLAINHLFFANNSILFGDASKEFAENIYRVISGYEKASRQKEDVIRADADQAEAILSIPLARSKPPDTMIWMFEGTRVYTEKSGYKLILHDKLQSLRDFPIAMTTTIKTFSELWTLQLPEKIKITLWKVYNDFIPMYANLNKRNIPTPVVCPLCQESYLHEIDALEAMRTTTCPPMYVIWRLPESGFIKLNFDSSFQAQEKKSISGVIARNEMGLIIGACTYPHFNIADAFVAEVRACEQAVRFAKELGFRRVQIEGDSLMIIKRLHSCTVDRSVLGPIVVDIKCSLVLFDRVTFHHVKREANAAAHVLAREGRRFSEETFWVEEASELVE
ncbi:hypothetical protein Goklo_000498 [Gossypium klotzschianum]|uniref:RNase H type-1 domain-containing protein n=1 Tax=Gossypium klotzschianum TaxID=34286 RepID=A0A7J8VXC5_9ROSI|nr:hypothetical protein [Gossypium klotzschianum]